jgi:uncharacterized protein (UPF0333 family)
MIKMDQRGQISIEYILLVAVVLAIVIVFALVITNQSEQNNVAAAAQLGATNATANLVFINGSQTPVKVTSVTMGNGSVIGSNVNMVVHFSKSVTAQQGIIFQSIEKSLRSAGFNNLVNTNSSITLTTSTGVGVRHVYFITLTSP